MKQPQEKKRGRREEKKTMWTINGGLNISAKSLPYPSTSVTEKFGVEPCLFRYLVVCVMCHETVEYKIQARRHSGKYCLEKPGLVGL